MTRPGKANPLTLAGSIAELLYDGEWDGFVQHVDLLRSEPGLVSNSACLVVHLHDGRELVVTVLESAVVREPTEPPLCWEQEDDSGPLCGLPVNHLGPHDWEYAASAIPDSQGVLPSDPDPVLEQLIREEEEIEARGRLFEASRERDNHIQLRAASYVRRTYACDGCGTSGFSIKMCPRCECTDTCREVT